MASFDLTRPKNRHRPSMCSSRARLTSLETSVSKKVKWSPTVDCNSESRLSKVCNRTRARQQIYVRQTKCREWETRTSVAWLSNPSALKFPLPLIVSASSRKRVAVLASFAMHCAYMTLGKVSGSNASARVFGRMYSEKTLALAGVNRVTRSTCVGIVSTHFRNAPRSSPDSDGQSL